MRSVRSWVLLLLAVLIFFPARSDAAQSSQETTPAPEPKESFNLILPYKDLTVGQGQEITMDAEVVNRRRFPVEVSLALDGVPKGWEVNFNSRYPSYPIRSVMVAGSDPNTTKSTTIEFKAKIPDNTKPGNYQIKVTAKDLAGPTQYVETLNFRVTSKKIETGGLKLTSQYPVLSTASGQTLKFTVDLKNETNKPLTTSLSAQAPAGWNVRFKPQFGDTQISSIQLKENATETLSVEIDTPARAEAGEHPVTIRARAGAFETTANLKVNLKGTQDLKMGSATGTLNTTVTAGKRTPVDFLVGNAGTAPIRNLSFITKKPNDKWTVEFKPDKIDTLNPGEVREIKMEILAPDRTIAGDYLLTLTANTPEINKSVEFRVTVSTPTIWGWIGFGIVGLVVIGLGVVFFRLGRR
ncbi:MAG TPA: NEW3 domain-containing protein [candidate division Zixibacteria bacterium]|nr:NEW3 domain-containing protein [candidate division Zixibacteria bacterium]